MARRQVCTLALIVGLVVPVVMSTPARAQERGDDMGDGGEMVDLLDQRDRPWAEGVSAEEQEVARALFEEGNALLKESLFTQAAAKYREALAHWEHPGIHYNLALALMSLDQPIEVYEALGKATRYGAAPLDPEKHERAVGYRQLLEQQLVRVAIRCDDEGARVTLDGKLLFMGPGSHQGLMRAGEHSIIAQKRGHLTDTRQLVFAPGEEVDIAIDLLTVEEATVSQRRWSAWKPWAVTGAGAVAAAAGGYLHWRALDNFDSFDREFGELCGNGCRDEQVSELADRLSRAEWQRRIAIVSSAVGGAALVGGLVLVYLNRPKLIRKDLVEEPQSISITPLLAPGGAGVSAAFRF